MPSLIDTRPFPPVPASFNLARHVLARGAGLGDKTALVTLHPDRDEAVSYAALIAMVRGFGSLLLGLGLVPGDRVLLRLANGPAFPVAFLGAIAVGLVPVASAAGLTGGEITRLAALADPRLVVADQGVALPDHPAPVLLADLAAWARQPPAPWHMGGADREGYIVFTSGSSGTPLAVSHAHRAILARETLHRGWEGVGPEDRLAHAGALNWTYTLGTGLLDPWTVGATALITPPGTLPAALPALLARSGATILAAVPGVFRQLLRAGLPPLPALRHALSAGEGLAPSLRLDWQRQTGTDIHEALGMTELSTYISGSPDRPAPLGSSGHVQPGRLIACLDAAGQPVPRGMPGELAVSTADPGFMRGYLHQPPPKGPWFRTGDLARIEASGAVTHLGRKDDLITAGGYRISAPEVEAAFHDLPGLTALAATEVEVTPGTRIIALFYEADGPIAEAALHQRAEIALARWKQPRHYQHVTALPRSANGKLLRRALAALFMRPSP